MLTGAGVGGFLWQEYNSLVSAHSARHSDHQDRRVVLDRLMGMAEARLRMI